MKESLPACYKGRMNNFEKHECAMLFNITAYCLPWQKSGLRTLKKPCKINFWMVLLFGLDMINFIMNPTKILNQVNYRVYIKTLVLWFKVVICIFGFRRSVVVT